MPSEPSEEEKKRIAKTLADEIAQRRAAEKDEKDMKDAAAEKRGVKGPTISVDSESPPASPRSSSSTTPPTPPNTPTGAAPINLVGKAKGPAPINLVGKKAEEDKPEPSDADKTLGTTPDKKKKTPEAEAPGETKSLYDLLKGSFLKGFTGLITAAPKMIASIGRHIYRGPIRSIVGGLQMMGVKVPLFRDSPPHVNFERGFSETFFGRNLTTKMFGPEAKAPAPASSGPQTQAPSQAGASNAQQNVKTVGDKPSASVSLSSPSPSNMAQSLQNAGKQLDANQQNVSPGSAATVTPQAQEKAKEAEQRVKVEEQRAKQSSSATPDRKGPGDKPETENKPSENTPRPGR